MAFAFLSSSNTSWFFILDGIGPPLFCAVGTSGLSAGVAAAALELEDAPTGGVDFDLDLDDDDTDIAAAAAELACGTFDVDLDDLVADDAIDMGRIVVGTLSLSLSVLHTPAPFAFLAAGLPLPLSVIDFKGPGISSGPWLLLLDLTADTLLGTGICDAFLEPGVGVADGVLAGDGVPFPMFTLIGTTGVGASGFAFDGFGNLFGCIRGVGAFGFPRADLDLGALSGGRYGCRYGVSGATAIGSSRIGAAICGVGDGDGNDTFMGAGAMA